jgi:hypothetical protein
MLLPGLLPFSAFPYKAIKIQPTTKHCWLRVCSCRFYYIIRSKRNYVAELSCCLLHSGFLLGLFFHTDDGCEVFLRNVGWFSLDKRSYIPEDTTLFELQLLNSDPDVWSFMVNHEADQDWSQIFVKSSQCCADINTVKEFKPHRDAPGSIPSQVVEFVDKVALAQVFSQYFYFPCRFSFQLLCLH